MSLQAIMRIGGTGESTKAVDEARDGFVGGAMPVGVVVAIALYLLRIRVVVRPGLVLVTPAPAASGKGGVARCWSAISEFGPGARVWEAPESGNFPFDKAFCLASLT
ncbi:hypothetical protein [Methylobacterium sp. V23]|uniref:hypothetical protein n=1 Tax=Methylobacterium sp. V23 TaxID=2044878 RepID=UPI000D43ECE8|nr:hypothetical protein [Methylobacterium sp. V23]POR40458.1 hypothetical protein CRT23_23865 [Methylobacterium sp. V23]